MSAPKMFVCNHDDCGRKFTTEGAMNMHAKALRHDVTGKTHKIASNGKKKAPGLLKRLLTSLWPRVRA